MPKLNKTTRRDGTVYWYVRADVAPPGAPRDVRRVKAPTRAELVSELARIRAARDRGELAAVDKSTVAELIDAYLAARRAVRDEASMVALENLLRFPRLWLGGRVARTVALADIQALVAAAGQPGAAPRRSHRDAARLQARADLADRVRAAGPRGVRACDLARQLAAESAVTGRAAPAYVALYQTLAALVEVGVLRRIAPGTYARPEGDNGRGATEAWRCGTGQAHPDKAPGYAASGVRNMITYLKGVFALAIQAGQLTRNPCAGVLLPADESRPADLDSWTRPQWTAFLAAADGDRLAAGWRLSAYGLRREEVLGLRWGDVDLSTGDPRYPLGSITVARARIQVPGAGPERERTRVKGPKSKQGARRLPIVDPWLPAALAALRAATVAERDAAGEAWQGPEPGDPAGYIVRDELGAPVVPARYSWLMAKIRDGAGLPPLRTRNGLRHTASTLMAEAGVPPWVRAAWCGHREVMQTGGYTHTAEDLGPAFAVMAGLMAPDGAEPPPADQLAPRRAVSGPPRRPAARQGRG